MSKILSATMGHRGQGMLSIWAMTAATRPRSAVPIVRQAQCPLAYRQTWWASRVTTDTKRSSIGERSVRVRLLYNPAQLILRGTSTSEPVKGCVRAISGHR